MKKFVIKPSDMPPGSLVLVEPKADGRIFLKIIKDPEVIAELKELLTKIEPDEAEEFPPRDSDEFFEGPNLFHST